MKKLLFSELRVLQGEGNSKKASKEGLELALIDNANLNAFGFDLKGEGIVKLAQDYTANPEMTPMHVRVKEFQPDIEVNPMYPNFPIQVLEMSELDFRVNQLAHYLSTYGLESMFNVEVVQGWLPETQDLMEREEDVQVVKLKTLDYLSPQEVNSLVIEKLIGRKERLLPNELKIAKEVVYNSNRSEITEIPFKENIGSLYADILLGGNVVKRYEALDELSKILKHPGDVLDLTEHLVVLNKYKHFKTSLKRGLVNLIEGFPTASIEENLASNRWSNKFLGKKGSKRSVNRNIALIDYMSFSKFSKNSEAMRLVNELKDGALVSWNQRLEKAYDAGDLGTVVELLTQRPGVYFRQLNRLYKNDVNPKVMVEHMREFAPELKTQSIVSALNNYSGEKTVQKIFLETLAHNLQGKEIEVLAGKKVFIEQNEVDYANSKLSIIDKFEEGGYIQSGMAIRIPEGLEFLRFFTYWNDESRIDIDLHASYENQNGSNGHVGWHGHYNNNGLTHSGDITHSDAAEYIDIDLEKALASGVKKVQFNLNSYTQVPFKKIDTVFAGLMALSSVGQKVKLYDQKNVIFRHDLENNSMAVSYGVLDLEKGLISIIGKNSNSYNDEDIEETLDPALSIQKYLSLLLASQGCQVTNDREEAEVVLGLAKSEEDNYVSLIDSNFFM